MGKCGAIPLGRFLWGDSFGAIAQTSQPRQTPTENFVKPINKTPTNPATKPIPLANNGIETLKVNPVAITQRDLVIAQHSIIIAQTSQQISDSEALRRNRIPHISKRW